MTDIISAVLVVGGIGLVFGCLLAYASMVFYVAQDERIDRLEAILPGANCGACGFAGCSAYAAAVAEGKAPVSGCVVGKSAVAQSAASIMGIEAEEKAEFVAHVMCAGNKTKAKYKFEYLGVDDCVAMSKLAGGAKSCPNGCLGMGSCVDVCKFGAISVEDGVAKVNPDKCTGCGMCVKKCPKQIIALVPKESKVFVNCSNVEKGAVAMKECDASCIGCKLCEKQCEHDAIHVNDNHAIIDYSKCTACGKCAEKCPKKVIEIKTA